MLKRMKHLLPIALWILFVQLYAHAENNNSIQKRHAYVTVVTEEKAINPALVMGASLRAMTRTSNVDYICLILPDDFVLTERVRKMGAGVSQRGAKILEVGGWKVMSVHHPIWSPYFDEHEMNDEENISLSSVDYNQIWIWSLMDYDKVIFLEHDLLVIQNTNEMFDRDLTNEDSMQQIAAAPSPNMPDRFNSGVMLIKPDKSVFTDMLLKIKTGDLGFDQDSIQNFEGCQGFLNDYFHEWFKFGAPHRLPPIYNAPFIWTENESIWLLYRSQIKVLHFYGDNDIGPNSSGDLSSSSSKSAKPWDILENPKDHKVSKYGAPFIYVWATIMFFVSQPTGYLEEESRHVLVNVLDVNKGSKSVADYMQHLKKGGGRKRLSKKEEQGHRSNMMGDVSNEL